jgi:hypothetical protein
VTISPGIAYDFTAYARVASGQPAGNVFVSVIFSTACDVDGFMLLSTPFASATGDWEKLEVGGVAPADAHAAFVDLTVERTTPSGTLDASFDSIFLPEPEGALAAAAALFAFGALGRQGRHRGAQSGVL